MVNESVADHAVESLGLGQALEGDPIASVLPTSAIPAQPWRISARPSPARPICDRAQPSLVRVITEVLKAVLLGDG